MIRIMTGMQNLNYWQVRPSGTGIGYPTVTVTSRSPLSVTIAQHWQSCTVPAAAAAWAAA
jgi:hypothetical protein